MQQLNAAGLKTAEHARNVFVAVAPMGATIKDALKPEFWSHVARKVKRWERIELRAEDDTWWADLLVKRADPLALHIEVISSLDLSGTKAGAPEVKIPKGYAISWGGPAHKYRVQRSVDGEILAHGMDKPEAIQWAIADAAANGQKAA